MGIPALSFRGSERSERLRNLYRHKKMRFLVAPVGRSVGMTGHFNIFSSRMKIQNQRSNVRCSSFEGGLPPELLRQGWKRYEAKAVVMVFRPAEADSGKPTHGQAGAPTRCAGLNHIHRRAEFKRTARCPAHEHATA